MTAAQVSPRLGRQWILTREAAAPAPGWAEAALPGGWRVHYHPAARVSAASRDGRACVVIGVAIDDASGAVVGGEELVGLTGDALEAQIIRMAGSHAVVHADGDATRLYADPGGMMCVYLDNRTHRAASSPAMLGPLERDAALDAVYTLRGTDDWYPGVRTPYVGLTALPANHALDLASWEARRYWPTRSRGDTGYEEGMRGLSACIRRQVEGLCNAGGVLLSLTGGYDSRVNFAAARNVLDRAVVFTIRSAGTKRCDLEVPELLTQVAGCEHVVIDSVGSPPEELAMYDEASGGMALGGRRGILDACRTLSGMGDVHLNGNLGALAKGFFWPDRHPTGVRAEALMREFTQRPEALWEGVRSWMQGVEGLDPITVYNLFYLEQRGARWMGPGETASRLYYESYTPFSSRAVFEAITAMPIETQRDGGILRALAVELWPELGEVPYCRATRNLTRAVPRGLKTFVKARLKR